MIQQLTDEQRRQCARERDQRERGIYRFRAAINRAKEKEAEDTTDYGTSLQKEAYQPVVAAVKDWLDKVEGSRTGIQTQAYGLIKAAGPDLCVWLTSKVVLSSISAARNALPEMSARLGQFLNDEVRFRLFRDECPSFVHVIQKRLDENKSKSPRHRKNALSHAMNKKGITAEGFSTKDQAASGLVLIDLFMLATEYVRLTLVRKGKKTYQYVEATDALLEWIERFCEAREVLTPYYDPMVCEPRDWISTSGGGYYTDHMPPLPLVRGVTKEHLQRLKRANLSEVYQALNAVQKTGWRVNQRVLRVMDALWHSGTAPSLPAREEDPKPPRADDVDTNPDALVAYKLALRDYYNEQARKRSKRVQVAQTMHMARSYAGEEAFWLPWNLDWRGRMYCVVTGLNPQGADYQKSLLQFQEGKPLGTEGAYWLAVHGANQFGQDKVPFSERIEWIYSHHQDILAAAQDPHGNLWWRQADEPWQFLAFCFEWERATEVGFETFVSHLPVAVDGSCNGIQHLSALLRDPVGGAAVNLVPSEAPSDIYAEVAKVAMEILEKGEEDYDLRWAKWGLDRKSTKRQVMVLPYGGTRESCRKYTRDHIMERCEAGDDPGFEGSETIKAFNRLSSVIWEAICKVVVKAREAMDWLQEVSKVASRAEIPIPWTSPCGFPVIQDSRKQSTVVVKSFVHGRREIKINTPQRKIDGRKQAYGIAPNFIHSLDAAALMKTVNACQGTISSWAMVHDSFGCLAADMPLLAQEARRQFVALYSGPCILEAFREDLMKLTGKALPPVPEKGSLDIQRVLASPYFFA